MCICNSSFQDAKENDAAQVCALTHTQVFLELPSKITRKCSALLKAPHALKDILTRYKTGTGSVLVLSIKSCTWHTRDTAVYATF